MQKVEDSILYNKRYLVIGRSGTGKTTVIYKFLKRLIKDKQIDVRRIVIFSKTVRSDPTQLDFIKFCTARYKNFKLYNTAEEIKVTFLQDLFISQKHIKDQGLPLNQWVVVNDDQLSEQLLTSQRSVLLDFSIIGRQYAICCFYSLQRYRASLNATIREQMTEILIGQLNSMAEIEDLCEQFSAGAGSNSREAKQNMIQIYNEVQKKPHQFLHISTEVPFGEGRLSINFSDQYLDKKNVKPEGLQKPIRDRERSNDNSEKHEKGKNGARHVTARQNTNTNLKHKNLSFAYSKRYKKRPYVINST